MAKVVSMLYAHQRLLLNLLGNLQGDCAGTDFQKSRFLFTQEFEENQCVALTCLE